GGEDSFKIDVRMISFTSLDLEEKISEGLFRDDLYYSINVMSIYIPPLRDRIEDIVPLTKYFIQKYSAKANDSVLDISKDSLIFIMEYKWLENIQQLENAIKSAVLMCDKNIIEPDDLPDYLREKKSKSKSRFQIENILTQKNMNYHEKLEACEKEIIKQALIETQYNKTQAAKKLGVTLRTLRNKLKKYNL
ncbi:hypothetical protein GWN26_13490, partial [Candidatus Saccharibacteria bacterium]|nr:hypothetical protein [Calditrichia bacterium]NIV73139.1 hypothetical protein [Calditrichia bacterium]NIW00071.1 hypothetical protein [Candidatus Saccharibacteria bacterium]